MFSSHHEKSISLFSLKACNQGSLVMCAEQQTSAGCQVTAVIGDNDENRIGGVGC